MRAPRYQFPDHVRSTTRAMASRMVREGTVAGTPEELDAWIARDPETRASLESGGFGREFGSHDLLPLLHVFVAQAGGTPPATEGAAPEPARRGWVVGVAVVAALVLIAVALAVLR